MAKDEQEPSETPDELEARRQAQREREQTADFDAADPGAGGRSLEDIEGAGDEEADGQFAFVVPETGRKITTGTLVPRGTPTEVKYKMSGKAIPNVTGGLPDPADTDGLLLVSFIVEDVDTKFTRDGEGKITKATHYVVLAPKHVVNARSEAGDVLLRGEPRSAA